MKHTWLAGAIVTTCLLTSASPVYSNEQQSQALGPSSIPDNATILRLFLKNGTSLITYGEPARVGVRVVFSMPTAASMTEPQLHLVNIAVSEVDWPRTERYAESARAARYLAAQAETDFAALTDSVARALNEISNLDDPLERLEAVENARKTLADWPPKHFNYK